MVSYSEVSLLKKRQIELLGNIRLPMNTMLVLGLDLKLEYLKLIIIANKIDYENIKKHADDDSDAIVQHNGECPQL